MTKIQPQLPMTHQAAPTQPPVPRYVRSPKDRFEQILAILFPEEANKRSAEERLLFTAIPFLTLYPPTQKIYTVAMEAIFIHNLVKAIQSKKNVILNICKTVQAALVVFSSLFKNGILMIGASILDTGISAWEFTQETDQRCKISFALTVISNMFFFIGIYQNSDRCFLANRVLDSSFNLLSADKEKEKKHWPEAISKVILFAIRCPKPESFTLGLKSVFSYSPKEA